MSVGLPLGVLVGFVGGTAFAFCILAALKGDALKAAVQLLGMPASWFGGGWLTTVFDIDEILSWYVGGVAGTTVVIGSYPLFRFLVWLGRQF